MSQEEQKITAVLKAYESALNAADTEEVMALYAPDGVFMPQHFASSVGQEAVRKAYDAVFGAIRLTVGFEIREVHQTSDEWAFARTNSAGTVVVQANGESSAEANQELFVMQKIGSDWKIARYCFSTTNPPRS
jgi:uncharacterized protein (TIGR02246 family)